MNLAGIRLGQAATALAGFVVLAIAWQLASLVLPPYIAPPVPEVAARTLAVLISWASLKEVLATVARTLAGLAGAFLLGGALAGIMGRSALAARLVSPLLTFLQGVPALSWVVFVIEREISLLLNTLMETSSGGLMVKDIVLMIFLRLSITRYEYGG